MHIFAYIVMDVCVDDSSKLSGKVLRKLYAFRPRVCVMLYPG